MTCIEQCEKYSRLVTELFPTSYADYKKMRITPISFVSSENFNKFTSTIEVHKGYISRGSKVIYLTNEPKFVPVYFRPNGVVADVYFEE